MTTQANPTPQQPAEATPPQPPAQQQATPVEPTGTPVPVTPVSSAPATPPPQVKTFTEEQVSAILAKARKEEKDKLYPELEKAKSQLKDLDSIKQDLDARASTLQQELEAVREGKASETESINRELREVREQNQKLSVAIEAVADNAAAQVRQSELRAFREKAIAESGLRLTELVSGSDEAEISASIEKASAREKELMATAHEEARAALGQNVPTPLAIGGSRVESESAATAKNRQNLARDPNWKAHREQILLEAKQKAGLV